MPRYIDVEKIRPFKGLFEADFNVPKFYDWLETLPTEDVRGNVHGRWIVDEDGNIECSICGHRGVGDVYCERCGAKMDEEEPTMEEYMYGQEGNEEDGSL